MPEWRYGTPPGAPAGCSSRPGTPRSCHANPSPRNHRSPGLRPRPRLHGHVRAVRRRGQDRVDRHRPRRPGGGGHPARHGRLLRHGPQRDADRRGPAHRPRGAAREGAAQREVRRPARSRRRVVRLRRPPRRGEELRGVLAPAARRGPHRRLPHRPRRPRRPDRGDRRRHRRAGRAGVRAAHRPQRGRRGDDPPGGGHGPGHRPPDRVLPDLARHRGGDPAHHARAGHRDHRLRRAVARPDLRPLHP